MKEYEYSTTARIEDIAAEFYITTSQARRLFKRQGNYWVTTAPEIIKLIEKSWGIE